LEGLGALGEEGLVVLFLCVVMMFCLEGGFVAGDAAILLLSLGDLRLTVQSWLTLL
jgi:hypothetical protein